MRYPDLAEMGHELDWAIADRAHRQGRIEHKLDKCEIPCKKHANQGYHRLEKYLMATFGSVCCIPMKPYKATARYCVICRTSGTPKWMPRKSQAMLKFVKNVFGTELLIHVRWYH